MTIERAEPIDRAYGLRYATTCFWWALRDAVSTLNRNSGTLQRPGTKREAIKSSGSAEPVRPLGVISFRYGWPHHYKPAAGLQSEGFGNE